VVVLKVSKVGLMAVAVVVVVMVVVEEETQRYQQHLKLDCHQYFHLQRIFCFERMLMQVHDEVERECKSEPTVRCDVVHINN
jgi:hypothetical protein